MTFENFDSVTLKFFPALIRSVSRQISRTICRTSTSRSILVFRKSSSSTQIVQHATWELLLSPRTTKLWRGYRVCPVRMYVSTYVRTYVRSFVCSPALATSFIIQFRYNFTQILDMTIPRISSRFSVIGSRSRSQRLFLEKLCHHSSAFIY